MGIYTSNELALGEITVGSAPTQDLQIESNY